MSNLLAVLPLAVVMIAGPQIISAVLLATSENPRRNSLSYLAGVTLATTAAVSVFYWLAHLLVSGTDEASRDDTKDAIDYAVIALLVLLAVRVFMRRQVTEPPSWMKKLQTATPRFSFKLGFLLFLLMPTDIIATMTVGAYLARHEVAWWHCFPFILLTVLLTGVPLLILVVMGKRADTVLPRMRTWMTDNSWIVSEIVIGFFLVLNIT